MHVCCCSTLLSDYMIKPLFCRAHVPVFAMQGELRLHHYAVRSYEDAVIKASIWNKTESLDIWEHAVRSLSVHVSARVRVGVAGSRSGSGSGWKFLAATRQKQDYQSQLRDRAPLTAGDCTRAC